MKHHINSPYLRQIMTEAVNTGTLEHIHMGVSDHHDDGRRAARDLFRSDAQVQPENPHPGGQLHPRPPDQPCPERGADRKNLYDVTGSIAGQIRAAEDSAVDMTPMVGISHGARQDEASAGIHGWNPRLEYAGEPDRAPQRTSPSEQEMLARVGELRGGTDESPSLEDGIILDTDKEMSDTGLPEAGTISLGNAQPKREAPAFAGASEYGREGLPSCIGRA